MRDGTCDGNGNLAIWVPGSHRMAVGYCQATEVIKHYVAMTSEVSKGKSVSQFVNQNGAPHGQNPGQEQGGIALGVSIAQQHGSNPKERCNANWKTEQAEIHVKLCAGRFTQYQSSDSQRILRVETLVVRLILAGQCDGSSTANSNELSLILQRTANHN